MASTPRLSQDSTGPFTGHSKIRGRTLVKPILKKLNSHSNSDRGSFDIDPGWDDLPSPLSYPSGDYDNAYSDTTPALTPNLYDATSPGANGDGFRGRDVSFSTSTSGEYPTWRSKNKYSHMRSTSGTSHTSSIATNISGRNGHFVHPFQQTPRTATPPLSYANSIASLDISASTTREYTSTINEHDGAVSPTTTSHPPIRTTSLTQLATSSAAPHNTINSRLRGPSLDESHRSASLSDGTTTPRPIPTTRSNSATTAILVSEEPSSESLMSSTVPQNMPPIVTSMSSSANGTSPSHLSPLRNSLDISGFRLRSRSEVDTRTHQEQVREARRKFQEKEKAKEEKYARQQLRRRERAEHSRERAKIRKPTVSSTSAKSTAMSSDYAQSHGADEQDEQEKLDFHSGAYDEATAAGQPLRADEVEFQRPQRRKTAKHKTNGVWTSFMLWFRTRLLRLGRH